MGEVEGEPRPLAAPDPIALHGLDLVGPIDEPPEVEKLLGVIGDAEEPLLEVAPLHHVVGALAAPLLDLLVGEHRLAAGAPVRGGVGAVGEALLIELEEEPLVPAVVLRQAADDLAVPVERRSHGAELAAHPLDVRHRPLEGVRAVLDRRVLGGQPEGVEAHGRHNVAAPHPHEAGVGVVGGVAVPVPDVQVARRVGVHRQRVPLRTRVVVGGVVEPVVVPAAAPLLFYGARFVRRRHGAVALEKGTPAASGVPGL